MIMTMFKSVLICQLFKTTRNILIANMALSDILLCVFTMPLTMLDLIHNYWPLGSGQVKYSGYWSGGS